MLISDRDNAIPINLQRKYVEVVAKGCNIRTETIDSGHSPFLSKPSDTVRAILRSIESVSEPEWKSANLSMLVETAAAYL